MTSSPQLPIELYRGIIRDPVIERRDLRNIALASRALSAEAYLVLYETVELEEVQIIVAAFETFGTHARVASLVQKFVLRINPIDFGDSWFSLSDKAIKAIHNMANLRELGLNYLWASDPHGPSLKPKGAVAWTRALNIPQVTTLRIDTSTYRPFRELFGELASPLPKLVTTRSVQVDHMAGITHVRCERVYGRASKPLDDLKKLEVYNMESFILGGTDWAPNLDTIAIVSNYVSDRTYGDDSWRIAFNSLTHVKKIGPMFFWDVTESFTSTASRLTQLEVIVLVFPVIQWRDFSFDIVESMARTSPRLRQVAVGCAQFGDIAGKIRQVKVFRRDAVDVSKLEAAQSLDTVHQWEMAIERVESWAVTLRVLLELD